MAHTCHATNCTTPVPPTMWGCRKHWFMVPNRSEIESGPLIVMASATRGTRRQPTAKRRGQR